ncbi:hypothetical protein WJX74_008000 [Apatococcus lobatus]|uniref:Ribosomal protein S11 n=2 Tax=Apatococcus TaxID=904362 RepID=A0AAW1T3M6_9CHLO
MASFGRALPTWLRNSPMLASILSTGRSELLVDFQSAGCCSCGPKGFATALPQRGPPTPGKGPAIPAKIPGPRTPGLQPSGSRYQGPVLRRQELYGTVFIQSTSNNTILTLTDRQGNPKATVSCGSMGFKNARKSSTYAAEAAATQLAQKAVSIGFAKVKLKVKGIGYGKQAAVRALGKAGLRMSSIEDVTPFPHNGCRAPKKRVV